jgi:hypothetical protein
MLRSVIVAYYKALDSGNLPSNRILSWIDEYNAARTESPQEWALYCAAHKSSPSHDAYDLFA